MPKLSYSKVIKQIFKLKKYGWQQKEKDSWY